MNNKGQITIFIILGVLVMITVATVVYVQQQKETELKVSKDILPVYNFLTNCLDRVSKTGLTLLGLQGGRITIPAQIKRNPRSYIPLNQPFNTIMLPFWYYEGEDRSTQLENMERELEFYIRDNIATCINDFEELKDWQIKPLEEKKAEVSFGEENTIINLKWNLEISKKDQQTQKQQEYRIKYDAKVKKMFDLAKEFMKKENEQLFLEKMTMQLLSVNPEIPLDGLEFTCSKKRWPIKEVKQNLQESLKYNIPYARIKNTQTLPFNYNERIYEDLKNQADKVKKQLEKKDFDIKEKDFKFLPLKEDPDFEKQKDDSFEYFQMNFDMQIPESKLKTSLSYNPSWGMLLNAQPNDGGVLKSNIGKGARKYLRFLCINQWHFTYNIIYPIVLTITDDKAFDKEPLKFQIATQVIINNNKGERKNYGLRKFETIEYDTDYCEKTGTQEADIRALGMEEGLPVKIELNNAKITFNCGKEECSLGTTKSNEGIYRLKTKLPNCANPFITASKEGYLPKRDVLIGERLDVNMKKLKSMNVKVVKHKYSPITKQIQKEANDLEITDTATIYLTIKGEDYDQAIEYPQINLTGVQEKLELVEDNTEYDIDVILKNKDFEYITGGYNAEKLKINYKDIEEKDTIIIHVIRFSPLPENAEETSQLVSVIYDQKTKEALKPEFK